MVNSSCFMSSRWKTLHLIPEIHQPKPINRYVYYSLSDGIVYVWKLVTYQIQQKYFEKMRLIKYKLITINIQTQLGNLPIP